MSIETILWVFAGLAVLFVGSVLARMGLKRLQAWMAAHPFASAIAVASVVTVVIAVLAGQNQGFIECLPAHKLQCMFMKTGG